MPYRDYRDLQDVDENFEWTSFDGRKTKFKDMDPEYLANIYKYFDEMRNRFPQTHLWFTHLMEIVDRVRRRKGVSDIFMGCAPYPHKSAKDDEWVEWDWKQGFVKLKPKQVTDNEFITDINK